MGQRTGRMVAGLDVHKRLDEDRGGARAIGWCKR